MIEYYKILEVNEYSSVEEIKSSFRRLAKLYHPDIYKGDAEKFRIIKSSYDWLIDNHKQKIKPKSKPINRYDDYEKYFRIVTKDRIITIPLDSNILKKGIIINCIIGLKEFRLIFEPGVILPIKISVTNVEKIPFELEILPISPESFDYNPFNKRKNSN